MAAEEVVDLAVAPLAITDQGRLVVPRTVMVVRVVRVVSGSMRQALPGAFMAAAAAARLRGLGLLRLVLVGSCG